MKINTHKLLLFLYLSLVHSYQATYHTLFLLFPDLSASGVRSLLHLLKQKNLIASHAADHKTIFTLTSYGELVINRRWPFLANLSSLHQLSSSGALSSPANGGGSRALSSSGLTRGSSELSSTKEESSPTPTQILVFLKSPSSDPHFRQLKQIMTKYPFTQAQRGVYLIQGDVPAEILLLCQEKYFPHVIFASIEKWHLDNRDIISTAPKSYSDISSSLSGISKLLTSLTKEIKRKTAANHQDKSEIFSVFQQLFLLMIENREAFLQQQTLQTNLFVLIIDFFTELKS